MARAIRIASIQADGKRIWLELRRDMTEDGSPRYRWYERETGADCEVSADTVDGAIEAAQYAWSDRSAGLNGELWDLRFGRKQESI